MSDLKKRPLRWGILGAGGISNDFCVALLTLPKDHHRIVHIAARNADRAESYASRFGIEKFSCDYKKVVEDTDVDVVYIATINATHKDLSILAMNHGKAVLCEKPATVNCAQLDEVLACARLNKMFYMEAVWTRLSPVYRELTHKLKEGYYGQPNALHASFGYNGLLLNKRFQNPALGGSVLTDIGFYPITIADMVFEENKVKEIKACAHKQETSPLDRTVGITMMFEENKIAVLTCSGDYDLSNDCQVLCSQGRFHVPNLFISPDKYTEQTEHGSKEFLFPLPATDMKMNFENSSGLSYEADHVRECLFNGLLESPLVKHSTTKRILGYLDTIRANLGIKFTCE